jgi:hypothetical protein
VTQQFKFRQFPAGNPLANVLVVVIGAIVIAVSFVLGIVAFVALASAVMVAAAIIGIRLWWMNRRLGRNHKHRANRKGGSAAGAEVIEGEFRVVGPTEKEDRSD